MIEPTELVGHPACAGTSGSLAGRRLVTAAGGAEPIDPARAITNRSSGKQGLPYPGSPRPRRRSDLIAGATAWRRRSEQSGWMVALQEMLAVLVALPGADGLLMVAAVADFRRRPAAHKIKKEAGVPQIRLSRLRHPGCCQTFGNRWRASRRFPAESKAT
jgi:phosphopantothenoylcysteine decarboxylase/phosphopantothenate--cysteine ligase